jgi:hypothetical protein
MNNYYANPVIRNEESRQRQTAIIKDISKGRTKEEIYAKYQITSSVLNLICEKHGIDFPKNNTQKRNELIKQDLLNNIPSQDILKKYNLTKYNLYQICRNNNFILIKSLRVKIKTFSILADLFDINLTYYDIAKKYGITRQRVGQIYLEAKKANIPGLPIRV